MARKLRVNLSVYEMLIFDDSEGLQLEIMEY